MRPSHLAGLVSLAALGAQAQQPVSPFAPLRIDTFVVTATRGLLPLPTLRDAIVISRSELEDAGPLSLGELLQRRAGIELRATGGPGQPQGIFVRGAGSAQTLVLVDGMRVGSATAGTTAIEGIPLEMIERIEVVKGPLSSLYGSEAAGGVIQVFTRGKAVPHLFATAGYGSDRDRRASAGLSTADKDTVVSLSAGVRKVDAPSATNARSFSYDPDRDPHENAFATLHASHRLWTGEILALDTFATQSRTRFDAGIPPSGASADDRDRQDLAGVRLTSATTFAKWWASRLALAHGRDRLVYSGQFPARFETRQDQASWINEFTQGDGTVLLGVEALREKVRPDRQANADGSETVLFTRDHRDTNSVFGSWIQPFGVQRFEASVRRDDERQFGARNTGSLSYGWDWPGYARLAVTVARGFRAPTFNDLYGPSYPGFYTPNPELRPERSKSREASLASLAGASVQWKVTAFDNRLDDLIVYSPSASTVLNVARARIRGVEAAIEATRWGVHWRAQATVQHPRDDDSGKQLQSRAERFASLEASRTWGAWSAGVSVFGSSGRFDSNDESPASRLPGYGVVDAHLRYAFDRHWSAQLAATNLADRRYESAVGYDAPRRGLFASVRFESF